MRKDGRMTFTQKRTEKNARNVLINLMQFYICHPSFLEFHIKLCFKKETVITQLHQIIFKPYAVCTQDAIFFPRRRNNSCWQHNFEIDEKVAYKDKF